MIESEPRGFGRSLERIVQEPEVHHQHQHQHQQAQEQNAQVEDVQQQVQRLDISDNNAYERNRARAAAPEPEPVPASAEEDAGVIRVSVTTTTTVSDAAASGTTPTAFNSNHGYNIIHPSAYGVTNDNMGLAYNVYLNSGKIYGCRNCKTHLANHEDIISRVSRLRPSLCPSLPHSPPSLNPSPSHFPGPSINQHPPPHSYFPFDSLTYFRLSPKTELQRPTR